MRTSRPLVTVVALLSVAALAACGNEEIASRWASSPIQVDGKLDEWAGAMTAVHGASARVGVMNDGEALYVAFGTDDPGLARIVARSGLTLWIDPKGGTEKELGVVFPQPAYSDGPPGSAPDMGQPGGARVDTVELLGPAPHTRKEVAAPGADGVAVAVGSGDGAAAGHTSTTVLTYELRVPLASKPWGAGVHPGDTIGIGVLTNRMAGWTGGRPRSDEGEGPGGPGGGRGGGGYGGRGRGGGMRPAPGEWRGLQAWTRVKLARAPH